METDLEKSQLALDTIAAFVKQFGDEDIYTKIVLEELFAALYGETIGDEIVPLPDQTGQERGGVPAHFQIPETISFDEGTGYQTDGTSIQAGGQNSQTDMGKQDGV